MGDTACQEQRKGRGLRSRVLARRDTLTGAERKQLSCQIAANLKALPSYQNARLPLFYISFRSEVDTHVLIKERLALGLPVAAPVTLVRERVLDVRLIKDWDQDLQAGAYGILEPVPERTTRVNPKEIDLVLVPGSVFDLQCGRYGYGGGFYDRFLYEEAPQALRVGLSYQLQLVQRLELKPHDQKMDIIVTEKRTIECFRQNRGRI